jgi:hypothetical protein
MAPLTVCCPHRPCQTRGHRSRSTRSLHAQSEPRCFCTQGHQDQHGPDRNRRLPLAPRTGLAGLWSQGVRGTVRGQPSVRRLAARRGRGQRRPPGPGGRARPSRHLWWSHRATGGTHPPHADRAVWPGGARTSLSRWSTTRDSMPRQTQGRSAWGRVDARNGCWDHWAWLKRPGTAAVSWATTPLETTAAARASLTCPASAAGAVVCIV